LSIKVAAFADFLHLNNFQVQYYKYAIVISTLVFASLAAALVLSSPLVPPPKILPPLHVYTLPSTSTKTDVPPSVNPITQWDSPDQGKANDNDNTHRPHADVDLPSLPKTDLPPTDFPPLKEDPPPMTDLPRAKNCLPRADPSPPTD
jgi:hypothetical protein